MTKSKEELADEHCNCTHEGVDAQYCDCNMHERDCFLAGYDARQAEIDDLNKSLDEECRINGMGAQRELKLITEISQHKLESNVRSKMIKQLEDEIEDLKNKYAKAGFNMGLEIGKEYKDGK